MLIFLWYILKAAPQFVREHDSEKPWTRSIRFRNPRPLSGGRNSESTSGPTRGGRKTKRFSKRGILWIINGSHSRLSKVTQNQPCLGFLVFCVFLASLNEGRNSVIARTTKRTPPAPQEGLFWSSKFFWPPLLFLFFSFPFFSVTTCERSNTHTHTHRKLSSKPMSKSVLSVKIPRCFCSYS